jgi:hypothetical protein
MLKVRSCLSARQQAQLLTIRDAMLIAPHLEGKKGSAAYATARRILKNAGLNPRNLRRTVSLALKLKEGIKCG